MTFSLKPYSRCNCYIFENISVNKNQLVDHALNFKRSNSVDNPEFFIRICGGAKFLLKCLLVYTFTFQHTSWEIQILFLFHLFGCLPSPNLFIRQGRREGGGGGRFCENIYPCKWLCTKMHNFKVFENIFQLRTACSASNWPQLSMQCNNVLIGSKEFCTRAGARKSLIKVFSSPPPSCLFLF